MEMEVSMKKVFLIAGIVVALLCAEKAYANTQNCPYQNEQHHEVHYEQHHNENDHYSCGVTGCNRTDFHTHENTHLGHGHHCANQKGGHHH